METVEIMNPIVLLLYKTRQGKTVERLGNGKVNLSPGDAYPCKGGGPNDYVYVYTSRANPEHWRRLLAVIGREDLLGDARYDSPAARAERKQEVDAMVAAWTRQHTKHEAMEIIGAAGIPAGAVLDTMELYNDKSFEDRGIMQTIQHPERGPFRTVGCPFSLSDSPVEITRPPLLGEHNAEILQELLEGSPEQLARVTRAAA